MAQMTKISCLRNKDNRELIIEMGYTLHGIFVEMNVIYGHCRSAVCVYDQCSLTNDLEHPY